MYNLAILKKYSWRKIHYQSTVWFSIKIYMMISLTLYQLLCNDIWLSHKLLNIQIISLPNSFVICCCKHKYFWYYTSSFIPLYLYGTTKQHTVWNIYLDNDFHQSKMQSESFYFGSSPSSTHMDQVNSCKYCPTDRLAQNAFLNQSPRQVHTNSPTGWKPLYGIGVSNAIHVFPM